MYILLYYNKRYKFNFFKKYDVRRTSIMVNKTLISQVMPVGHSFTNINLS